MGHGLTARPLTHLSRLTRNKHLHTSKVSHGTVTVHLRSGGGVNPWPSTLSYARVFAVVQTNLSVIIENLTAFKHT